MAIVVDLVTLHLLVLISNILYCIACEGLKGSQPITKTGTIVIYAVISH